MPPRRSRAQEGPPPLLHRLYGEGKVVCLRELLLRLSEHSAEATVALRAALVQPNDHADYAQALLERTWCVLHPGAPCLRDGFTLYAECNQVQLVNRAVEWLLGVGHHKSGGSGGNVLCYGYRKKRPTAGGRGVLGMATAESSHHNSTTASLCSPAWQLLLSRIGDTLMLYLLLHTSMFLALPNFCCLQLSGPPLSQVARAWRKAAPATVSAAATQVLDGAVDVAAAGTRGQWRQQLEGSNRGLAGAALTQLQGDMPAGNQLAEGEQSHSQSAAVGQPDFEMVAVAAAGLQEPDAAPPQQRQAQVEVQPIAGQGGKKARPSSWQRRQAAKLRQQSEQQPGAAAMQMDGLMSEWCLPPTQQLGSAGERSSGSGAGGRTSAVSAPTAPSAAAGPGPGAANGKAGARRQHREMGASPGGVGPGGAAAGGASGRCGSARNRSSWPLRMPRPTDMLLQRSGIFYCASFSQKPGLTSQHMLSKLRDTKQADQALIAAIFDPRHSPVGRLGATLAVAHSAVPPPPRRVPARQRHLLPLLARLIERASKCPFAILLQHHCPLPPQLRDEQLLWRREQQRAGAAALEAGPQQGTGTALVVATAAPAILPAVPAATVQAPLPSHAALLQEVRQQRLGLQQKPMEAPCLDQMMDELFRLEQEPPQQAQQTQQEGQQASPPAHTTKWAQQQAPVPSAGDSGTSLQPMQYVLLPAGAGNGAAVAATASPPTVGKGASEASAGVAAVAAAPAAAHPGSLAICFVPHKRVVAFVWSVVRAIVPAALLGDGRSQRVLRDAIGRFVRLRRYEQISVHQVMAGLRVSGMPWLQPRQPAKADQQWQELGENSEPGKAPSSQQPAVPQKPRQPRPCPNLHAAQQRQLTLWLGWLFMVLIAPLLRSHFYCTESEAYRQQVFYYRKPVWAALARAAIKELQEQQFTSLSNREAHGILQGRKLGVARLRLLPKRTGMRFIVNLGKASTVRFPGPKQPPSVVGTKRRQRAVSAPLQFKPVNHLLQNVYQVLRFEASCQPHLLGASVFGYNDAFCKLHPFLRKWRAAAKAEAVGGGALQPLLVSADVSRAFDCVDIPLLLALVEPLLRHEQYLVLKYWEVVPSLGQIKVIPRRLATAALPDGAPPFPQLAQLWAGSQKGKAFTDQVVYDLLGRQQALELLRQHLTANLVRLRRRWCFQSCGIAQGSTLSTLLCSLYLAHLERTQLAPILEGQLAPDTLSCAAAAATAAGVRVLPGNTAAAKAAPPPTVVFLAGGNSAVVRPAAVLSMGGVSGATAASSSSKGMLTELARAVNSLATAQSASAGIARPGSNSTTPDDNEGRQSKYSASGGSLTGDLLLLPASMCPATSPSVAAGSSPAPRGSQRQQAVVPASSSTMPPRLSGQGCSQQAQPEARLQPLGCSRLALHVGSVLLRLVDDFLLITAVPAVAQGIASRMLQGFARHNVFINPDKTKLSFALQLAQAGTGVGSGALDACGPAIGAGSVMPATVWRSGDGSTFVKWCGLLVNTQSLEVQGDYTRYSGEHISTSLTLPLRKQPGAQLPVRLCQYLRPKIHPLLLDITLNSPQTVRLNVYQAFLLGAMKFHCYVKALPATPTPGAGVLLEAVLSGISFMAALTRRSRVASAHYQGLEVACATHVPQPHIRWLGLTAFLRVLRRKQTLYAALLAQLQELADAPGLRPTACQLAPIVDAARSSVFDTILY